MKRSLLLAVLGVLPILRASTDAADLTSEERAAARKVYVVKCAKCHRFHEPTNYTEVQWRGWMQKMERKSKLKPDQADLLSRYLDAYRAGRLPGKPENIPSR